MNKNEGLGFESEFAEGKHQDETKLWVRTKGRFGGQNSVVRDLGSLNPQNFWKVREIRSDFERVVGSGHGSGSG